MDRQKFAGTVDLSNDARPAGEVLCYSVEDASAVIVAELRAKADCGLINIQVKKLGGYRLLHIHDDRDQEPMTL